MSEKPSKRLTELQAAKQARVISATQRLLLSARAIEDIRVEEIAAASRVAVASLYKRFGTKDGVIAAALVDYFDGAVSSLIAGRDARTPLEALVYGLDTTARRIIREPEIARALMAVYFRSGETSAATDGLTRRVFDTYFPLLERMHGHRVLADWVDLGLLGTEICDRQFGVVAKWALGKFPDAELGNRLRLAVLTILRGASVGAQAAELDSLLAKLHKRLS